MTSCSINSTLLIFLLYCQFPQLLFPKWFYCGFSPFILTTNNNFITIFIFKETCETLVCPKFGVCWKTVIQCHTSALICKISSHHPQSSAGWQPFHWKQGMSHFTSEALPLRIYPSKWVTEKVLFTDWHTAFDHTLDHIGPIFIVSTVCTAEDKLSETVKTKFWRSFFQFSDNTFTHLESLGNRLNFSLYRHIGCFLFQYTFL